MAGPIAAGEIGRFIPLKSTTTDVLSKDLAPPLGKVPCLLGKLPCLNGGFKPRNCLQMSTLPTVRGPRTSALPAVRGRPRYTRSAIKRFREACDPRSADVCATRGPRSSVFENPTVRVPRTSAVSLVAIEDACSHSRNPQQMPFLRFCHLLLPVCRRIALGKCPVSTVGVSNSILLSIGVQHSSSLLARPNWNLIKWPVV